MKVILRYSGSLSGNRAKGGQKSLIRCYMHHQLKEFWKNNHVLNSWPIDAGYDDVKKKGMTLSQSLATDNQISQISFVPLVNRAHNLSCRLDILMLHSGGALLKGADLDNRIKTLIDGLRKPQQPTEIDENIKDLATEGPIFTLLQDDNLVTGLSVRTALLNQTKEESLAEGANNGVFAIIEAEIVPHTVTIGNASYLAD